MAQSLNSAESWLMILLIFLLQFVNYGIENAKWRVAYKELKSSSFIKTWKAVYAGNAIALFTPDRLGTFIGRFGYLKDYSKTQITYTTFVGNYAQLCTTLLFAVVGMVVAWNHELVFRFPEALSIPNLVLIFTPITVLFFSFFFYQELLIQWFSRFKAKWMQDVVTKLNFVQEYSIARLTSILVLSALRYLVFVLQFYIAIKVFQLDFDLLTTLSFCGILYLFSTLIPSPFMGNLGTREAVAVYLLSNLNGEVAVISASLFIWLINVVFPSILGGLFFLTKKEAL